jgi:hypothetical protein
VYLRFITIVGDEDKVEKTLAFIGHAIRPVVEARPGNRGTATAVAAELGCAIDGSYWDDMDSMRAADVILEPLYEQAATLAHGPLRTERFEVVNAVRHAIPADGGIAELTRFEFDPDNRGQLSEAFSTAMLPTISRAPWMCSVQLLTSVLDNTGIISTIWADEPAARQFWLTGCELRTRAAKRAPTVTFVSDDFYQMTQFSASIT